MIGQRDDDDPDLVLVWDGSRELHDGLLFASSEPTRAAPRDPKPGPGRPPRAGERATERIEVRLTLTELRSIRDLARAGGCTVAELIRTSVLDRTWPAAALVDGRDVPDSVRK